MKLAAFTLAELNLSSVANYVSDLSKLLRQVRPELVALPAYSSLLLAERSVELDGASCFQELLSRIPRLVTSWNDTFLQVHADLARQYEIYLVPGTFFELEAGTVYHSSCCFDPTGEIIGRQRQTHLSAEERELSFGRGGKVEIFSVSGLKAGILIGNDARHPEVGRLMALKGADLVIYCGALLAGPNCWEQVAGVWAQVQQNQFWAVESQLYGRIAGRAFGADPVIHGPCDITPGMSGYLDRRPTGSPFAVADVDEKARQQLKSKYPLLKFLNPEAYRDLSGGGGR